jgi:molybdopterin-guanine dinucleotide biosynthesis protein A
MSSERIPPDLVPATALHDAVVLAGGRGSRMGGPHKPGVVVAGRRLLDHALAAAAGAVRIVVVGDVEVPPGVLLTREEPAFGGPVAGLEAGLRALAEGGRCAEWTLVLASDLPDAEAAVSELLAVDPGGHDGVCLLDADGRLQWLLGCYRTGVLADRLARRGDLTAMYRLLEPLDLLGVTPARASVADVDTAAEAAAWEGRP